MPIFNSVYKSFEQGWKPGANTVAYYKFDNNLNDSSGNGNTASMAQGTAIYYTVNGDNKAITASGNVVKSGVQQQNILAANHTLSFWIDFTSVHTATSSDNRIIGCLGASGDIAHIGAVQTSGDGRYLYVWQPTGGSRKFNYTFTANQWYNIILSIDGSLNCSCYIQGTLIDTKAINAPGTSDFYFGVTYQLNDSNRMDGYLDDIIIENKAWSSTEAGDYFAQFKGDYGIS